MLLCSRRSFEGRKYLDWLVFVIDISTFWGAYRISLWIQRSETLFALAFAAALGLPLLTGILACASLIRSGIDRWYVEGRLAEHIDTVLLCEQWLFLSCIPGESETDSEDV